MTTLVTRSGRLERLTSTGVRTVAAQEFRLRLRTGRWRWLLAAWTAVIVTFAVLLRLSLAAIDSSGDTKQAGPALFGGTLLFVLGLALLVVPALTAQSINGDRERGTLATLQVTLLSASEIGLGKLVAAWGAALAFLVLTLPVLGWAYVEGGLPIVNVAVSLLVVALLLGVVCAIALGWSAVFARSIASALVSYLTVFALTIGTLIAFGLATALTTEKVNSTFVDQNGATQIFAVTRARTDRTWPLLAANPFVVLADAAPSVPITRNQTTGLTNDSPLDPLGNLGDAVRAARRHPDASGFAGVAQEPGPIWPLGLGIDVALGIGAVVVTIRRLRMPARKLGRGVRVA